MYDIHCHVLAGIDDGASDIEESLNICRTAYNEGITAIVATPHYIDGESESQKSKILALVFLLNQELKNIDIDLMVLPGMEVYVTSNLLELYDEGKIITLNCKNYMLIELPLYNGIPSCLEDVLFKLQVRGVKPVIAHPERCKSVIDYPNLVNRLIERGCIIQVNSGSIEGLYGKSIQKTANTLLEHNMVHLVGSDSHSSSGRKSFLRDSFAMLSDKYGKGYAEDLFVNNQYKIINGEKIIIGEPVEIKKKRFWVI